MRDEIEQRAARSRKQVNIETGKQLTPVSASALPDIPIAKLPSVVILAELFTILLKTLIELGVVSDKFEDDYDLEYFIDRLKDDLTVDW